MDIFIIAIIVAAKLFQQKHLRIIDFFGTVALARLPTLVLTIFLAIMRIVNPDFMNVTVEKAMHPEISVTYVVFAVVVFSCIIWQIITYFSALKESSGLMGTKLWIAFIGALFVCEVVSGALLLKFI